MSNMRVFKADFNRDRRDLYSFEFVSSTGSKTKVHMLDSGEENSPRFWFFFRSIYNAYNGKPSSKRGGDSSREYERLVEKFPGLCRRYEVRKLIKGCRKQRYQLISYLALKDSFLKMNCSPTVAEFENWFEDVVVAKMKELNPPRNTKVELVDEVDESENTAVYEDESCGEAEFETSSCTDLVVVKDGVVLCDSLGVARRFEKEHAKVTRSIRKILLEDVKRGQANFGLTYYTDSFGRNQPYYTMTRDGFSFLVMGFTGAKANAWKWEYIDAFNYMEAEVIRSRNQQVPPLDSNMSEMFKSMIGVIMEDRKDNRMLMTRMLDILERIESKSDKTQDYQVVKPLSHMTVLGYAKMLELDIDLKSSQMIGKRATRLCNQRDLEVRPIQDERYEFVNAYPIEILKEIFTDIYHGHINRPLVKKPC